MNKKVLFTLMIAVLFIGVGIAKPLNTQAAGTQLTPEVIQKSFTGIKPVSQSFSPTATPLPRTQFPTVDISPASTQPCQIDALITISVSDQESVQQAIGLIELQGGCVVHIFEGGLIGAVPIGKEKALIGQAGIAAIYHDWVTEQDLQSTGSTATLAAYIWNHSFVKPAPEFQPEEGAPTPDPLIHDVFVPEEMPETNDPRSPNAPAPGYSQLSEFMAGKIAVGIILPESNGVLNTSTENWDTTRMNLVVSKI